MEDRILEATASLRNHSGSARKARLVLDQIRGKSVSDANKILEFSNKRMAIYIQKLLKSACANVTQIEGKADVNSMRIDKAFADDGRIMKRWMPRAKSQASPIKKKTCHITIGITGTK